MTGNVSPKGAPGLSSQQIQQQRQTPPPTAPAISVSPSLAMDPGNLSTDDAGTVSNQLHLRIPLTDDGKQAEAKRQGVRNPACDHCREKKVLNSNAAIR